MNTSLNSVSASFFDTMAIPILEGRVFTDDEAQHEKPVPVVVNETFARQFFRGQDALGAGKRDVAVLLLADVARIVGLGVAGGLVACVFLARPLTSALYGVKLLDPDAFGLALGLVAAIAIVAGWGPVNRAMRVDPAIVLRDE